jgi:hypothetical protein
MRYITQKERKYRLHNNRNDYRCCNDKKLPCEKQQNRQKITTKYDSAFELTSKESSNIALIAVYDTE